MIQNSFGHMKPTTWHHCSQWGLGQGLNQLVKHVEATILIYKGYWWIWMSILQQFYNGEHDNIASFYLQIDDLYWFTTDQCKVGKVRNKVAVRKF